MADIQDENVDIQGENVFVINESDLRTMSGKTRLAVRALADALYTISRHEEEPDKGIQELVDQDTETRITYATMASDIVIKALGEHIGELKKARESEGTTTGEEESAGGSGEERA